MKKHEVFGGKCKTKYVRLDLQQNSQEHCQQRKEMKSTQKWEGLVIPRTKIETFLIVDRLHSNPSQQWVLRLIINTIAPYQ